MQGSSLSLYLPVKALRSVADKSTRRMLILLFLVFSFFFGSAQFSDTTNYYFRHSSTGIVNKTNDRDSYVLNNSLRFSMYRKNISLNSTNTWIYGKQQHVLSNNDFISILDFDVFKTQHSVYYWGLLNYEKSFSLNLDHRFQGGAGVGYYLIDTKSFVFQVSDGILYERSDLRPAEGVSGNDYETFRNSLRLKFRLVHNNLTLENTDFVQHSLSDRKDYILRSHTNLSVKLWKLISFTVALNYNKLNITGRENFLLNYGLSMEKYF
jgi:hypothetical protein